MNIIFLKLEKSKFCKICSDDAVTRFEKYREDSENIIVYGACKNHLEQVREIVRNEPL